MRMIALLLSFALPTLGAAAQSGAEAAPASDADLITASVAPLPAEYRDAAEVRSWTEEGELTIVREGTNAMICLADRPGDDQFHAACYHESLEPFMESGRRLRAEGLSRDELQAAREKEIEAGTLPMPQYPAALYSLTGPPDSYDKESKQVVGASPLYVVYMPYATTESTGLPARAPGGQPWLMNPGKPWAHVMLLPPADDEE